MRGPVRSTIAYRPWHGGLFSLANNSLDCSHSSCQVKPSTRGLTIRAP